MYRPITWPVDIFAFQDPDSRGSKKMGPFWSPFNRAIYGPKEKSDVTRLAKFYIINITY
jgi:hypothetical protein